MFTCSTQSINIFQLIMSSALFTTMQSAQMCDFSSFDMQSLYKSSPIILHTLPFYLLSLEAFLVGW